MNSFIVTLGNHGKPWLELAFLLLARIRTKVYGQLSPHCDVHPNNEYALPQNCHFRRQNHMTKFRKPSVADSRLVCSKVKPFLPVGPPPRWTWITPGYAKAHRAALPLFPPHINIRISWGRIWLSYAFKYILYIIINTWGLFKGMWS